MSASGKQTQDRLDLRLPRQTKDKLRKASALAGTTLTQYILAEAEKAADAILAKETTLSTPDDVFDRFMAACEAAQAPNAALQKAADRAAALGIK